MAEFIKAQSKDDFCQQALKQIRRSRITFLPNNDGVIIMRAPIYGALNNGTKVNATKHAVSLTLSVLSKSFWTEKYVKKNEQGLIMTGYGAGSVSCCERQP